MNAIDYEVIANKVIDMAIKAAEESGNSATCVPVTIDNGKDIVVNEDWHNPVASGLSEHELSAIGREIDCICKKKGCMVTMYNYQLGVRYWDSTCKFPESITIFIKDVCPEFVELQKLCKEKLNINLGKGDLYKAETSGKRGRYFEEVSTRKYFCYYPNKCRKLIDSINACTAKGIKMHIGKHEDQEDRQASIYYETECYGSIEYDICPVTMG